MMIMIDPSGFGRRIGQPDDPDSISFKLKLGGYHLVYSVSNSLSLDGFVTTIKARWIGSGRANPLDKNKDKETGVIYSAAAPISRSSLPPPTSITVVPGTSVVPAPAGSAFPVAEVPVHGGRA
jgi:hypothetical protein